MAAAALGYFFPLGCTHRVGLSTVSWTYFIASPILFLHRVQIISSVWLPRMHCKFSQTLGNVHNLSWCDRSLTMYMITMHILSFCLVLNAFFSHSIFIIIWLSKLYLLFALKNKSKLFFFCVENRIEMVIGSAERSDRIKLSYSIHKNSIIKGQTLL